MNKIYKINPFFLYDGKELLLQNDNGISLIKDSRLANLLKEWDRTQKKNIYYRDLELIFREDTAELITFLIDNDVLQKPIPTRIHLTRLVILSDKLETTKELVDLVKDSYAESFPIFNARIEDFLDIKLRDSDFVLISLENYTNRLAESISRKIIESNCLSLFGHYYAGNYYIDNFYKYDWYLPCHRCNMANIQAELRSSKMKKMNYQALLDQLYKLDEDIVIGANLTKYQRVEIVVHMFRKLKQFIGNQYLSDLSPEDVSISEVLNLKEDNWLEGYVTHWELCDCYEK